MYRFPVMEILTQNDHFFQIFLCRNLGEWTLKLAMVDQGIVMFYYLKKVYHKEVGHLTETPLPWWSPFDWFEGN